MDAHIVEPMPAPGEVEATPASSPASGPAKRVIAWERDHPLLFWWGVSIVLAILSGIIWPTIPSYDPFSWVVWGREVTDPHIPFFIGSGPSWKPLPFFFTTIYGALGSAAPTLWVITARVGGIAGLIGLYRLAARLCARGGLPRWAGAVAGVFAALGIVLTNPDSGWTYYFFRGTSEVILIAVWVWAIERLLDRRYLQSYLLVAAEGLMRPEAWPFLLLFGAWLFWRHPSTRVWVVLGLIAQPVGWFGPPWISTGQPFLAATHASEYNGQLGTDWLKTVLQRGESLQPLPSLAFGVFAVLYAIWVARGWITSRAEIVRRWTSDESEIPVVLALGVATVAWWVIVVGETGDHYPGLPRFYLPAAAMTCALSGYGLVRFAALVADGVTRAVSAVSRMAWARAAIAGAVTVVCLGGSVHYVSARWTYVKQQKPLAATAVTRINELGTAIARLGGQKAILPCSSSVVTINHSLQTALAWKLGTTLERVETVMTKPGIAFVGPHDSIDGGPPFIDYHFQTRTLAQVGAWSLQQVWPVGTKPGACIGT